MNFRVEHSVSNICWARRPADISSFLRLLSQNYIGGAELALSCFWSEPVDASREERNWLKTELSTAGVKLVSLHSLTFSRPDLNLFASKQSRRNLVDYLKRYSIICAELGCQNMVFGSPKARQSEAICITTRNKIFSEVLFEIDEFIQPLNVNFNVEPLAPEFCNYLNSFSEVQNIVTKERFSNIFALLDVRSLIEVNENINDVFTGNPNLKHVHVGNPGLCIPGKPHIVQHKHVARKLRSSGYAGFVSAEVARDITVNQHEHFENIVRSLRELYD